MVRDRVLASGSWVLEWISRRVSTTGPVMSTHARDRGHRESPARWVDVLRRCAELQRGEARFLEQHLEQRVPDLHVTELTERYHALLTPDLPRGHRIAAARRFGVNVVLTRPH